MRTLGVILIALLFIVGSAVAVRAANITRDAVGGNWSTVNEWDPNALPTSADTAIHDPAFGTLTYDAGVPAPNQNINSFEGTGGGSPTSRLQFAANTTLDVDADFMAIEGASSIKYQVTLPNGAMLIVGGTIIGGRWFVQTNSEVTAGSIDPGDAAWTIEDNGIVTTTNDFVDPGPNDAGTLTVRDEGTLEVAPSGSGDLLIATIDVEDDGTIDVADNMSAFSRITIDGGTLIADTAGADANDVGVGMFQIENDGTAIISGEVRINEDSRLEYGNVSSTSNTLTAGSVNFRDAGSELARHGGGTSQSLDLTVSGDIDVETTAAAGLAVPFNSSGVSLTLDGNSAQDVEIVTPDYDVNDVGIVWQGLQNCTFAEVIYNVMPLAGLVVESGATVDITDENVNILRGTGSPVPYPQDALYVDGPVHVSSGATVNLGPHPLYHTGARTGTGTINGTVVQVTKVCYGDFDADGDVDTEDFAKFAQAFGGSNAESINPLCSADLDGDVDLADFGVLAQQFTGADQPCPSSCAESGSGGGEWGVEELAEWCMENLSSGERESFAEMLDALAEQAGETQESADMAELAYLITAE